MADIPFLSVDGQRVGAGPGSTWPDPLSPAISVPRTHFPRFRATPIVADREDVPERSDPTPPALGIFQQEHRHIPLPCATHPSNRCPTSAGNPNFRPTS